MPFAKKALLESRHYVHDLKPLLTGQTDIGAVAESLVKEFQMVAGTPARFATDGPPLGFRWPPGRDSTASCRRRSQTS